MKISFIGSGAWATALANVVSENGHETIIYGISNDEVNDINLNHCNSRYLKDVKINENIKATLNINEAVSHSDVIVLATPSSQIRNVINEINPLIDSNPIILNVSKSNLIIFIIPQSFYLYNNIFCHFHLFF